MPELRPPKDLTVSVSGTTINPQQLSQSQQGFMNLSSLQHFPSSSSSLYSFCSLLQCYMSLGASDIDDLFRSCILSSLKFLTDEKIVKVFDILCQFYSKILCLFEGSKSEILFLISYFGLFLSFIYQRQLSFVC